MPWKKGQSGNPNGRAKGQRNHATEDIRAIARGFVDDPAYRETLRQRLLDGTLSSGVETMLWAYSYGRAGVDLPADGTVPTSITIHF